MIFNILYGVLSCLILVLAGCQNHVKHEALIIGKPLESCERSIDSLQDKAQLTHLKSTELTPGQYDYSSGEIIIDHPLKSGDHLRMHAIESISIDSTSGRMTPQINLICQESVTKTTSTEEFSQYAPRTIHIKRDERGVDAAFRGVALKTPNGTLSYQFLDSAPKMGMNRADFQKTISEAYDESYFVRLSPMSYQFIGKRRHADGGMETIRMTLKKSDGNFSKDALLFDPIPDTIFKI